MNILRTVARAFGVKNRHLSSPWRRVHLYLEVLEARSVPAVYWWVGPNGGDSNWANGDNWLDDAHQTTGTVPTSIDYAYFGSNGGNDSDCVVNGNFEVDRVIMGLGDYTSTMTVGPGQSVTTAWGFTQFGTLNLLAGSVATNTNIYVGGTVNATGLIAESPLSSAMTAATTIVQNGGTINVVEFPYGLPVYPNIRPAFVLVITGELHNGGDVNVGTLTSTPLVSGPASGRLRVAGSSIDVLPVSSISVLTPPPSVFGDATTSTLDFMAGPSGIFNVSGTFSLTGATVTTDTRLSLNLGTLIVTSGGVIGGSNGSVYNSGTITWTDLSTLAIGGGYSEYQPYDGSTLNMLIDPTGANSTLTVGGTAELYGILHVDATGALPTPAAWALIAAAGGIAGDFNTFELPGGYAWGHAISPAGVFTIFE